MSLLAASPVYKPFSYPWAYDAWLTQQRVHWLPEEVPLGDDIKDWHNNITEPERNLLTQIFRFFTQADVEVSNCYTRLYMPIFKPTEVLMMLSAFNNAESIHVAAYSYLLDTVGMPESEYGAFMQYKAMKDKYDYFQSFTMESKYEIAKTLAAFGAFTEGLQLFASFAILLNFPRHNKMRGMGQIIAWSVRDECYAEGTEILTPRGWVDFAELNDQDDVAQRDMKTGVVSFVSPTKKVEYDVNKELVEFSAERKALGMLVTPEHDIVYESDLGDAGGRKIHAKDFVPHSRSRIPVSGRKSDGRSSITPLERFRVAFAADGAMPPNMDGPPRAGRHTGERAGHLRVTIDLKKDRKIDRLHRLLNDAGLSYDIGPANERGMTLFRINAPLDISKSLASWVNLADVSATWCDEFFDELVHWDGHDRYGDGDMNVFGTVQIADADLIQSLCAISGRSTKRSTAIDPRGYQDYHRTSIKQRTSIRTGGLVKRMVPYKGKVRCVVVPSGAVVIRYQGNVQVSGNTLHCLSVIKLFRTFVQENPEIWTDSLRRDLHEICHTIVIHEDAFIDLAFGMGPVEGLTPDSVKRYIRYMADRRLQQLGLDPIYGVTVNPLPWVDDMLNAVEHANFFESRATEYSRASMAGAWDDKAFETAPTVGTFW